MVAAVVLVSNQFKSCGVAMSRNNLIRCTQCYDGHFIYGCVFCRGISIFFSKDEIMKYCKGVQGREGIDKMSAVVMLCS